MNKKDFLHFLSTAAGLTWQFNRDEKKIKFLNKSHIPGLGDDAAKLLQNLVWAKEYVIEEDFFRFKMFIEDIRAGKKASVILRLRDQQDKNTHHWLRIEGAPGINDSNFYYGFIRHISYDVDFINRLLEKDLERQTMIQSQDHPVLLIDMETKTVISRNTFAYDLFGYNYHEFNAVTLKDLYPLDQTSKVSQIYETCLLEGGWEGNLTLLKKNQVPFHAGIKIKRLSVRDRNLLKFSIHALRGFAAVPQGKSSKADIPDSPALSNQEQFKQTLLAAMEDKYRITEILETFLSHQYIEGLFDAVMYADVHVKKGKVDVYTGGDVFESIKPGSSFDYEGTISQVIGESELSYLIREEIMESTIPIDWALFIPHGIRSYFAKSFFHGGKLRSLLMLCSTRENRFSDDDLDIYELYYPAFLKGLRNWRKGKKLGKS
jgi:hypothetical protein